MGVTIPPPPSGMDGTWTGYATSGTPLVVSRRTLSFNILNDTLPQYVNLVSGQVFPIFIDFQFFAMDQVSGFLSVQVKFAVTPPYGQVDDNASESEYCGTECECFHFLPVTIPNI